MQQKNKRRYRLAQLCSFVIPGGGHLLLGAPLKGLLILTGTLLDLAAMVRYAGEGSGQYTLLIVYLGLAVPVFWFYSVFDTLQLADKVREDQEGAGDLTTGGSLMLKGAILAIMGLLLLGFVHKVSVRAYLLHQAGLYAPGAGLAVIAVLLFIYRGKTMFKMGRLTAAAVILTVGGLLLSDQILHRNDFELLGQWWPAAFILLGLEVVVYGLIYRTSSRKLTFDLAGGILAAVIVVAAFGITQYATTPFRWLDQWKDNMAGTAGYGEEKGFKYELEMMPVAIPDTVQAIEINNPNGEVQIVPGQTERIEIRTLMWVDASDPDEAQQVKQDSEIAVHEGETLTIEAKGASFGSNNRMPRMNMIVTIPARSQFAFRPEKQQTETFADPDSSIGAVTEQQGILGDSRNDLAAEGNAESEADAANAALEDSAGAGQDGEEMETGDHAASSSDSKQEEEQETLSTELHVSVNNGMVKVSGLYLPGGLNVKLTNGEIVIHDIEGGVRAETKNGNVEAANIAGDVHLETYNGNVAAAKIDGRLEGSTLSGSMKAAHISGNVEIGTKNGQIEIEEALAGVKADTLNGDIEVSSSVVGGNWNIDSSIGEIRLLLPHNGSYSVNGAVTFGSIATDLPLTVSKKTVTGDIGDGQYRININANSSITVNRYN